MGTPDNPIITGVREEEVVGVKRCHVEGHPTAKIALTASTMLSLATPLAFAEIRDSVIQ